MVVYVETSAIAAWLLEQPAGWLAFEAVQRADAVVSSDLSLVECERTLRRLVAVGDLSAARADLLRRELVTAVSAWSLLPIGADVVARAREPFPDDTIRAVDAIHLATALTARVTVGDLAMITLDHRVHRNAVALGFRVLPE
ncbi:MAG: type II toxin-antitoxin system VapC family toxin [Candidatus Limnocylindrales bacterium]